MLQLLTVEISILKFCESSSDLSHKDSFWVPGISSTLLQLILVCIVMQSSAEFLDIDPRTFNICQRLARKKIK